MFKKTMLLGVLFFSLSASAYTKLEWTTFLNEAIVTDDNISWNYDVKKLKSHIPHIKNNDINILIELSNSDDEGLSQSSKYLLATQGEKANKHLFDYYLKTDNLKNGLYYFNFNFVHTVNKDHLWKIVSKEEQLLSKMLLDEFSMCKDYKDYYSLGGKDFTFENYDDFFEQRNIIQNYSMADLFSLELELSDAEYPVTITFYNNRYIFQSDSDDNCSTTGKSESYIQMQKIMALYKQYEQKKYLNPVCESYSENSLLKSRFNYYCASIK